MNRSLLIGLAVLIGMFAGIAVGPDVLRYIRISRM